MPNFQYYGATGYGPLTDLGHPTRMITNFVSNATGPTGPASLSFAIMSGIAQSFDAVLNIYGATGGIKFGINGPSGSQVYFQMQGISTGTSAQITQNNPPSFGLNATPFNINATGPMNIYGNIVPNDINVTGTAQIVMGCMAATGPTGYIGTGSYLMVYQST